jgi:hypothetical protein
MDPRGENPPGPALPLGEKPATPTILPLEDVRGGDILKIGSIGLVGLVGIEVLVGLAVLPRSPSRGRAWWRHPKKQEYYKSATRVLQKYYTSVTRVSQECYKSVTGMTRMFSRASRVTPVVSSRTGYGDCYPKVLNPY